jgi:hypothetical protein
MEPEVALDEVTIGRAAATVLPNGASAIFERAEEAAEIALAPVLAATGRWLRLRSVSDFAARLDDLRMTADRLVREAPDESETHRASFARESQRLRDLFAVSVEASLSRVCFIQSPICLAAQRGASDAPALRVDLGRGAIRPLQAARRPDTAVSRMGHVGVEPFSSRDLTVLPDRLWREAVAWLLEQLGHVVEQTVDADAAVRVVTSVLGQAALVIALRAAPPALLSAADVGAALPEDVARSEHRYVLTPSAPSAQALAVIERAGARLIGPEILNAELVRLSTAYADERAASDDTADALAQVAAIVRALVIGQMESLEAVLVQAANTRRAAGAAVKHAAGVLRDVWARTDQAFVAWETLLADWQALFPDRAARDGSLRLRTDDRRLGELRERADHLFGVTREGLARLTETPGAGEMGYTAWRRALLDELTARCESARWRMLAMNPAEWRDYAHVTDAQALERAESGRTAAVHARARAEKAYAQLATRARI